MDDKHNSSHNFHTSKSRTKDLFSSNNFVNSNIAATEEEENKYPDIDELEFDSSFSDPTTSLTTNGQWAFEVLYKPNAGHFGHFYISLIYSTQNSDGNWQDHTILSIGKKNFFYISSDNIGKQLSLLELEKDLPSNQSSSGGYKIYTQEHYPVDSKNAQKIFFWLEEQLFCQKIKCQKLLTTNDDLKDFDLSSITEFDNTPYFKNLESRVFSAEIMDDYKENFTTEEKYNLKLLTIENSTKSITLNRNKHCKSLAYEAVHCLAAQGMLNKSKVKTAFTYPVQPWLYGKSGNLKIAYQGTRYKPQKKSPPKVEIFFKRELYKNEKDQLRQQNKKNKCKIYYIINKNQWIFPDYLDLEYQKALEKYLERKRQTEELQQYNKLPTGAMKSHSLLEHGKNKKNIKKIIACCENILSLDVIDLRLNKQKELFLFHQEEAPFNNWEERKELLYNGLDESEYYRKNIQEEIGVEGLNQIFHLQCQKYLEKFRYNPFHFFGKFCVKQAIKDLEKKDFSPSQFYVTFFGLFYRHHSCSKSFCYFFCRIFSNAQNRWDGIQESVQEKMKPYLKVYTEIYHKFESFQDTLSWQQKRFSREVGKVEVFFDIVTAVFDEGFQNNLFAVTSDGNVAINNYINEHKGDANNNDLFFKFLTQLKGIDDCPIDIDQLLNTYQKTPKSEELSR